jgi:hypothetical protein
MFFLSIFDLDKVTLDTDQEISVTVDARSKYTIEEGLCSLIEVENPVFVHWFHKVDLNKVVNAHRADSACIINTAHPCVLINNTDEKIAIEIKNLNNVIETYKKSLDK